MIGMRLLALALLALPLGAQAPLRMMTWNLRYGTAADGPDAWPHRRAAVIRFDPDHRLRAKPATGCRPGAS